VTAVLGAESNAASSKAGEAARETFAAMDAEVAAGTPTWVHAGAHRAEAGFQDPALGWVGVRAETSGGAVHASVVPGSAEAAQALNGHMEGLNAYLAEHHTPVESLTMAAPEDRRTEAGMDQNAGQSMNQGTGQDAGQDAASGQQSSSNTGTQLMSTAGSREVRTQTGKVDATASAEIARGGHISVMA
jgi:hypothetical protein